MSSFFKNIAVTYWTAQIYNDTDEDMRAEIDEEFTSPLVDAASNYVCSVERMELSGNNIFFYDTSNLNTYNVALSSVYPCSFIYFLDEDYDTSNTAYTMSIYSNYSSLGSLIESMNSWKRFPDFHNNTGEWLNFSLSSDGKIRVILQNEYITIDDEGKDPEVYSSNFWRFNRTNGIVMAFSDPKLASIFGLPHTIDAIKYPNPKIWFEAFSNLTPYLDMCFETKSSRVDCGNIPTMLQLRSTMPFESDQVSSTKTNIVTDFNIVANSDANFVLTPKGTTIGTNLTVKQNLDYLASDAIGMGMGSMIIYTPNERRWLNFSAPLPIYNVRLWVELISNDPDETNVYYIPPGGKFSIKLGLYLRDA